MTGVAAAKLAQKDLNGASAVIVEKTDTYRGDVDRRWYMGEQYFKSYPVCRRAQAPIEGARSFDAAAWLCAENIRKIHVNTFHEAVRLATNSPKIDRKSTKFNLFSGAGSIAAW